MDAVRFTCLSPCSQEGHSPGLQLGGPAARLGFRSITSITVNKVTAVELALIKYITPAAIYNLYIAQPSVFEINGNESHNLASAQRSALVTQAL
jgi:hypothetical protein